MTPPAASITRAKSSAATRQAMLDAARACFLQESYENVGLRDIAGAVGVDVALVSRYFGSKEELFRAVLGKGEQEEILPPGLPKEEIPTYLASLFLEQGNDGNVHVERLLIILRSASSPIASQIVCEALREDVLEPLAEKLGGPRAELRASSSMAVWMGMTIMRTIMSVEPLCRSGDDIEARLRRLFATALEDVTPN